MLISSPDSSRIMKKKSWDEIILRFLQNVIKKVQTGLAFAGTADFIS